MSPPNLPSVLVTKAAVELHENPKEYDFYLGKLSTWIDCQTTFRACKNDNFLLAFLRAAKFDLDKCKQRIENFYLYRHSLPELFANRDINDPKVEMILKEGSLIYLPEPAAADGPRVIMIRPACYNMSQHDSVDVFRVLMLAVDLLLYEDYQAQVAGFVIIMDLANVPRAVILDFRPLLARKFIEAFNKNIFPARFKGVHLINTPSVCEKLYNMVKGAISEKLRDRFIVHGNKLETLDKHLPRSILPKEYGGNYDMVKIQDDVWRRIVDRTHILLENANYGMLDTKIKMNPENDCGYGVIGSFKKLNID